MLLYTASTAMLPGVPFYAVLLGWSYYWGPVVPSHHWEWPPSVDAEYFANESAFYNATSDAARKTDLFNVESINSQALPTIVLAYPDNVWAYNTARWAGWPSHGDFDLGGGYLNNTALVDLHQTSGSPTTTISPTTSSSTLSSPSSSSSVSSSLASTQTTSLFSTSVQTSSQSLTTTSTQTGNATLYYVAAAVVVVIIVVAALVAVFRRRRL
jgi:hypothetical protein